jgi:ornithine cyclodeaminase/alanine dehydrogenase-like protein (mu-crystallin family)
MPLLINNEESAQVLAMPACMEMLEKVYRELGEGAATNRNKSNIHIPTENPDQWYRYCSMEGGIRSLGVAAIRIKSDLVTTLQEGERRRSIWWNTRPGKYCGLILLFSAKNGELLAILNDGFVQHLRVGATSGIAARHLSRKNAKVAGILGTGGMARAHLEAFSLVRKLEEARVFSPNPDHRRRFAEELGSQLGIKVRVCDDPHSVVRGADIVATCTDSMTPVLPGGWIERGMFVSSVTSAEMEESTFAPLDGFILFRTGAAENHFTTPEDWRPPSLGGSSEATLRREEVARDRTANLVDVIVGKHPGRTAEDQVFYFLSEGVGVQFATVAYLVFQGAKERGLGRDLPLEWFLQDIRN